MRCHLFALESILLIIRVYKLTSSLRKVEYSRCELSDSERVRHRRLYHQPHYILCVFILYIVVMVWTVVASWVFNHQFDICIGSLQGQDAVIVFGDFSSESQLFLQSPCASPDALSGQIIVSAITDIVGIYVFKDKMWASIGRVMYSTLIIGDLPHGCLKGSATVLMTGALWNLYTFNSVWIFAWRLMTSVIRWDTFTVALEQRFVFLNHHLPNPCFSVYIWRLMHLRRDRVCLLMCIFSAFVFPYTAVAAL